MGKHVTDFFHTNAEHWVLNGYKDDGYNYPVGLHRLRIIIKILESRNKNLNIVDLGSGGGNIALALAEIGHSVTGVDGAAKMIKISNELLSKSGKEIQNKVTFYHSPITENSLEDNSFDVCIAMGVVGYFEDESKLFNEAHRLLKPGGIFIISTRNRLFNMQSLTFRTKKEIINKNAIGIIEEIESLYERVPEDYANNMIDNLKKSLKELSYENKYLPDAMKSPAQKIKEGDAYKPYFEPKQHTPNELMNLAIDCDFSHDRFFGVHPHIIDPNLNYLLPPKVFNLLSSCLESLEELPISLVLSSVFIGSFVKK